MLDCEAAIDPQNIEGSTPLHLSVVCEREEVTRLLLARGADASTRDGDGCTPRDLATEELRSMFDVAGRAMAAVGTEGRAAVGIDAAHAREVNQEATAAVAKEAAAVAEELAAVAPGDCRGDCARPASAGGLGGKGAWPWAWLAVAGAATTVIAAMVRARRCR